MTFMMDWTCTSITLQSIIIYAAHHRRRLSLLFNPWLAPPCWPHLRQKDPDMYVDFLHHFSFDCLFQRNFAG
jgi:hypothetical protein